MEINFTKDHFNAKGVVSEEVIEYVIENVEDFEPRYHIALKSMESLRCGLDYADEGLFSDIVEAVCEFLDVDDSTEDASVMCKIYDDIEEVFG